MIFNQEMVEAMSKQRMIDRKDRINKSKKSVAIPAKITTINP